METTFQIENAIIKSIYKLSYKPLYNVYSIFLKFDTHHYQDSRWYHMIQGVGFKKFVFQKNYKGSKCL